MLPASTRYAIAAYSQPSELVVDPMCGIGTTPVEAAHLGRHEIGVEQALGMLRAAMDADQVCPDIWFISDHGNPYRLDPDQP
jgi:hypothetical protein